MGIQRVSRTYSSYLPGGHTLLCSSLASPTAWKHTLRMCSAVASSVSVPLLDCPSVMAAALWPWHDDWQSLPQVHLGAVCPLWSTAVPGIWGGCRFRTVTDPCPWLGWAGLDRRRLLIPVQSSRSASHSQGGDEGKESCRVGFCPAWATLCEKFLPLAQREQPLCLLQCLSDSLLGLVLNEMDN